MTTLLRIKQLRQYKNYSIRKLSDLTGIPKSTLNDLENNKVIPKEQDLEIIAKALGVTQKELWKGD